MEASQPLSIESFSYSWLVNLKPSFEGLGLEDSFRGSLDAASDEASFIEMDPRLPASRRFFRGSHDFNFAFPTSESPLTLVHADELISNGFLMPLVLNPLKMEAYHDSSDSNQATTSLPSHAQKKGQSSAGEIRCSSLRRCRRLSKRIFHKYFGFVRPLCQKLRNRRSGSRVGAVDSRMPEAGYIYSTATSPRASVAYSADNWRRSCDSESSIYEAVLHCKRSIGK